MSSATPRPVRSLGPRPSDSGPNSAHSTKPGPTKTRSAKTRSAKTYSAKIHSTKTGVLVAGRPGGYASLLANKARVKAGACVLVAAACIWVLSKTYEDLTAPAPDPLIPAAMLVVVAICAGIFRVFSGAAAAAAVGARSERRVAKCLVGLKPTAVLNSVDLAAGGDADHMVLGPKLLVVETKTGNGVVRYEDGKLYVGHKALRGDPVAQCRRQALAAKQMFSTFCDAVVCVADMQNAPFTVSSVVICSLDHLPSVVYGLQDRIAPTEAHRRAMILAPRCSTIHEKPGQDTDPSPRSQMNRSRRSKATSQYPTNSHASPSSAPRIADSALSNRPGHKAQPSNQSPNTSPPMRKLSPRRSPR